MQIYPAIDIKDGNCVRLVKGDFAQAKIFHTDPAAQAKAFHDQGATWMHVVDLDGARSGAGQNAQAIAGICKSFQGNIQLGGGIRDMVTITRWLDSGVTRVILGTAAIENPQLVDDACAKYPGRIAVGLDARGESIAVSGWEQDANMQLQAAVQRFDIEGLAAIIYTDIDRDGTMQGAAIARTASIAKSVNVPVIASGGVASIDDVIAARASKTIAGVICGRALYDGRLDLAEALDVANSNE